MQFGHIILVCMSCLSNLSTQSLFICHPCFVDTIDMASNPQSGSVHSLRLWGWKWGSTTNPSSFTWRNLLLALSTFWPLEPLKSKPLQDSEPPIWKPPELESLGAPLWKAEWASGGKRGMTGGNDCKGAAAGVNICIHVLVFLPLLVILCKLCKSNSCGALNRSIPVVGL